MINKISPSGCVEKSIQKVGREVAPKSNFNVILSEKLHKYKDKGIDMEAVKGTRKERRDKAPIGDVEKCRTCRYSSVYSYDAYRTCDYFLKTGRMRGCPGGSQCTKYEEMSSEEKKRASNKLLKDTLLPKNKGGN